VLIERGLPVRLTSGRKVVVRLRLLTRGGRTLAGPSSVTLRPGRLTVVGLKPSKPGQRILRSERVRSLTLQAAPRRGSKVSRRVRLG
jgi:hypothetical protein